MSKVLLAITILGISSLSAFWISRAAEQAGFIADPSDGRFDPEKFRFEHYGYKSGNEHLLPAALLKMFPPGTDKSYVDHILRTQAKADYSMNVKTGILTDESEIAAAINTTPNNFSYNKSFNGYLSGWTINVIYDDRLKAKGLYLGSNNLYIIGDIDGER